MADTVKGLRTASAHIEKAERILQGVNVVLESTYIAYDLKMLGKTQNAIAELILTAPRIDSYERATEFMTSVSDVEEMFAKAITIDMESLWETLNSKPLNRAEKHLEDAEEALSGIDAEEEWSEENPDEDEDDE